MEGNGDKIKVVLTRENIQETEEVPAFLKEKKNFVSSCKVRDSQSY